MVAPNARRLDGTVAEDIRLAHAALDRLSGGLLANLHIGKATPFQVHSFPNRPLARPRPRRRPRPRTAIVPDVAPKMWTVLLRSLSRRGWLRSLVPSSFVVLNYGGQVGTTNRQPLPKTMDVTNGTHVPNP
jgi:hypothetical protein